MKRGVHDDMRALFFFAAGFWCSEPLVVCDLRVPCGVRVLATALLPHAPTRPALLFWS